VKADRTAYDVLYSCRPLSGIAVVTSSADIAYICTELDTKAENWYWWCSQSTYTSAQTTWPILYIPTATMIRHGISSARRPALFHVRARSLATELSLWLRQSCGTVCQRQFVTRTQIALFSSCFNHWQCNALQVLFRALLLFLLLLPYSELPSKSTPAKIQDDLLQGPNSVFYNL